VSDADDIDTGWIADRQAAKARGTARPPTTGYIMMRVAALFALAVVGVVILTVGY
jgi:hypothetical protein